MDFSLGLIEVSALGHAIVVLDDMLKVAEVEFVATERKLGGRLVSLVVKGELTAVKASIDAGKARAMEFGCYKESNVIARPHEEILKFLHLDEENEKEVNSETAATHVGAVGEKKTETKKTQTKKAPAKTPAKRGRKKKTEEKA